MEMEEIVKIIIFVIVLAVGIGIFLVLKDGGGSILEGIKGFLRFGR